MAIELVQTAPDLLTLTIRGVLSHPELVKAQRAGSDALRAQETVRILVDAQELAGIAREGDWDDMSFQVSDRRIARMAIIADPAKKGLVLMFAAKGLRRFPIEFFAPQDAAKARAWLDEPVPAAGI